MLYVSMIYYDTESVVELLGPFFYSSVPVFK